MPRKSSTPKDDAPPKRKRGGQKGNANALRHGFYATLFTAQEGRDLAKIETDSLLSEINLARAATRRVFALHKNEKDPDRARALLDVLNRSVTAVANLLRTQMLLTGKATPLDDLISGVLAEMDKAAA